MYVNFLLFWYPMCTYLRKTLLNVWVLICISDRLSNFPVSQVTCSSNNPEWPNCVFKCVEQLTCSSNNPERPNCVFKCVEQLYLLVTWWYQWRFFFYLILKTSQCTKESNALASYSSKNARMRSNVVFLCASYIHVTVYVWFLFIKK